MIASNVSIHEYEDDEQLHLFLNDMSLGYFNYNEDELWKKQLVKLISAAYDAGYKKGVFHIQSDLKSILGINES